MASDTEFVFHSNNLPNSTYPFFEDMRHKRVLCDITFEVGERSISAHRIILAAGIPYFRDTVYKESATSVLAKEIEMPDIDFCAFEALIEFVYSCKIAITCENVKNLLSAACALRVEEVREACCKFLKDRLDPETVLDVRHYANNLNCLNLVETVDYYIRKNFEEVSQSESFLNLSTSCLKELIRKDDLGVSSEEKVYESIIRWVKNVPSERKSELPELLKNVRLTLLNPRYLLNHVASQEFIRTSIPCRDLLDEAKNYHLFPEKNQAELSFPTKPRNFGYTDQNDIQRISGAADIPTGTDFQAEKNRRVDNCKFEVKTICSWQCFDSERNEWYTYASDSILHDNNGWAVQHNKSLFFFFRNLTLQYCSDDKYLKFIQCFAGSHRVNTGATVLDNCLYICGGRDLLDTNTVEKFDFLTNKWLPVTPMVSCRMFPGAVTLKGCVYILGGLRVELKRKNGKPPTHILKGVERYIPKYETWTSEIPMLIGRYGFGSAALNDNIFVCGGQGELGLLNSAEAFDSVTNQWKLIHPMRNTRSHFSLIPCREKLYVLGGHSRRYFVQVYNPETNEWSSDCPLDLSMISDVEIILLT